ncbi:substrate-binding periplasmic protein [Shewanella sp.]|uniref:substrate-binding periplasmic protein n=1 Tax=Shewanella sp. TaxID=50422 RepID=UPI0035635510
MFKSLYMLMIYSFVTLFSPFAHSTTERPLTFCVEVTEFPPFNYFVRENNIKTDILAGYDIDILKRVFEGVPYQVVSLPWRRCLMSLTTGAVDAAMSASMNEQRQRDYISSEPYYYLTPGYFYLAKAADTSSEIASGAALQALGSVCGLGGHNYAQFGLTKGSDVIRMVNYRQLAEMLKAGRCRYYLDRLELLPAAIAILGESFMPPLHKGRITGAPSEPFFMLISPKSSRRSWLQIHFNDKIAELRSQGQLAKILEYHQRKLTPDSH